MDRRRYLRMLSARQMCPVAWHETTHDILLAILSREDLPPHGYNSDDEPEVLVHTRIEVSRYPGMTKLAIDYVKRCMLNCIRWRNLTSPCIHFFVLFDFLVLSATHVAARKRSYQRQAKQSTHRHVEQGEPLLSRGKVDALFLLKTFPVAFSFLTVQVKWKGNAWYSGVVKEFESEKGMHRVLYDDSDDKRYVMPVKTWQVLPPDY